MGDTFVDVSYRGLELGKRVKLRDVRPEVGYLEHPLPMPVGTRLDLAADDGVAIAATVIAVHEQVAGNEHQPPGMRVKPALDGVAKQWWQQRIDAAAVAAEAAEAAAAEARAKAEAEAAARAKERPAQGEPKPTMVMSADMVNEAVRASMEPDVKDTQVMEAVDPDSIPADDGKRTTVMDAIDISMITGVAPAEVGAGEPQAEGESAEITIEGAPEGEQDEGASRSGKTATNGKKKSRRKKR
jgi:hypothetical protein